MKFNEEENAREEGNSGKVVVGFKDVVALTLAIYRTILPKLAITLLALFLAGILMMKFLAA